MCNYIIRTMIHVLIAFLTANIIYTLYCRHFIACDCVEICCSACLSVTFVCCVEAAGQVTKAQKIPVTH